MRLVARRLQREAAHHAEEGDMMAKKSFYERLGRYDAMAVLVDDLFQRLLSDPHVDIYWKGRNTASTKRDRHILVDYLCHAAGGPVVYTGHDMQTAHAGLGMSDSDWQVTAEHVMTTLEACNVPGPEKKEL